MGSPKAATDISVLGVTAVLIGDVFVPVLEVLYHAPLVNVQLAVWLLPLLLKIMEMVHFNVYNKMHLIHG